MLIYVLDSKITYETPTHSVARMSIPHMVHF